MYHHAEPGNPYLLPTATYLPLHATQSWEVILTSCEANCTLIGSSHIHIIVSSRKRSREVDSAGRTRAHRPEHVASFACSVSHLSCNTYFPRIPKLRMSVVASTWDVKRPPRRAGQRSTNGCVQCRRRKIKCDEQKPTCNHCVKQRLTCSWSQRPWKFVDVNEKVSEGYEVLSEPSDHQSPQLTDWIELNPIEYVPKAQYRAWNGKQETESATMSSLSHSSLRPPCSTASKSRIHLVRSPKYTRIPPSVDAGPTTRSQMLIAALYHYLPTNEPKEHRGEHEHPRLTFLNLFNNAIFHPRTSFLAAAIDSFTLAQASLALGDVRLAFAAIRRYSACLSKLNVALTKSRLYNHDDVLLCILVLSILEVCLGVELS